MTRWNAGIDVSVDGHGGVSYWIRGQRRPTLAVDDVVPTSVAEEIGIVANRLSERHLGFLLLVVLDAHGQLDLEMVAGAPRPQRHRFADQLGMSKSGLRKWVERSISRRNEVFSGGSRGTRPSMSLQGREGLGGWRWTVQPFHLMSAAPVRSSTASDMSHPHDVPIPPLSFTQLVKSSNTMTGRRRFFSSKKHETCSGVADGSVRIRSGLRSFWILPARKCRQEHPGFGPLFPSTCFAA